MWRCLVMFGLLMMTSTSARADDDVDAASPGQGSGAATPAEPPPIEQPKAPAPAPPSPADEELPPGTRKSPGTAFALSFGITMAGVATAVATVAVAENPSDQVAVLWTAVGLVAIGPSVGHVYAGDTWSGGLILRAAAAGLMVVGGLLSCPTALGGDCNEEQLGFVIGLGVIAGTAGVVHDLVTVRSAARRYNRTHKLEISVAPTVGREPGVAVIGRF